MDNIKVTVLNAKQVEEALKRSKNMVGDNIFETLQLIGMLGTKDAKHFVAHDTGRLEGSITYTINGKQFGYQATGKSKNGDKIKINPKDNVVIWGTNVFYGPFIEARAEQGGQFLVKSYLKNKLLFKRMIENAIKKVK